MNPPFEYIKRHPIRHTLYLTLGLLTCAYSVYVFYWMAHLPYSGYYAIFEEQGMLEVTAVDPKSPADRAGLRAGDQILRIGGRQVLNAIIRMELLWTLRPGLSYPITYKRGATHLTSRLTLAPSVFPYRTLLGLMLGMVCLGMGLMVYLKRPFDPSARIFYLNNLCGCAANVIIFNFLAAYNPAGVIWRIIAFFVAPLMLHFVLIFPERKEIIREHPSLLGLIYVPTLALFFMGLIHDLNNVQIYLRGQSDPVGAYQFLLMAKSYLGLYLVYVGAAFACLAHTFATTRSFEVKKQLKWIFWGGGISLALSLFGFYTLRQDLPLYLSGARPVPFTLIMALVILIASYCFALFKYRLMDIDIVIHRSLAYFLVSGIIVILYFLLFGLFSWIFEFLIGKSTFATYVIAAMVVAFMFRPLLIRVEEGIDRLFYREKYAFHRTLGALSQDLITARNPQAIFQKVHKTVDNTLHVRSAALWLLDKDGKLLASASSFSLEKSESLPALDIHHPLALRFLETRKGFTRYQAQAEQKFQKDRNSYLDLYRATDMEILLPLIYENTLLGMIGFGKKRSGDMYSSSDVGLLTTLAHQTAIAMENARAYHRTDMLNKELADKVKQIEQQQEEILALQQRLLNENIYLREEIQQNFNFEEIIGSSTPMKAVLALVEKVAPTLTTVFLRGESGTGKELIARAIHFNSPRRDGPFIKVNCAAIPANLLESELFGHEKGAFTDAKKSRAGKFELASGGTIFLDEIGDLGPDLQAKLLRVLQERDFERVGGTKTFKVDVRIIAATNRDIENAISSGSFREDLFYRLNVISITLPPLRERREDIRELTIHFLNKFGRQMGKSIRNIDPDAMETLKTYDWPGNIRELANVIERAVVLGEGQSLSINDLPQTLIPSKLPPVPKRTGSLRQEIERLERQFITEALEKAKGNKSMAARILGIKRSTFVSKLQKYGMVGS